MPRHSATLIALATAGLVAAISGCSKPGPSPSDQAASSASPPAAADPATQPGGGRIKLDIKLASGEVVYGDPAAGKTVFNQCVACHSSDAGVNRVGPSLHAVVGRPAGAIPGFHYSAANKGSGLSWTEQELYAYLENPQKIVPGTYMTFEGLKDPQKRADVIAYLEEDAK